MVVEDAHLLHTAHVCVDKHVTALVPEWLKDPPTLLVARIRRAWVPLLPADTRAAGAASPTMGVAGNGCEVREEA